MITVSSMRKTETFDLNGGGNVRKFLAQFLRCDERSVVQSLAGQVVRLGAQTITTEADYTTALRDNDVINIFPAQVAAGGVKGALAC